MSIIFGIANLDRGPVEGKALLRLAELTQAYAPDGTLIHTEGPVGMGFQPYHTTARSRLEVQPFSDAHENLIVFDGRLDNCSELADLLSLKIGSTTDSSLVLAAFDRWGEACFERLVGDWSLALWSAGNRKLYLARDHAGTRTLYYKFQGSSVVWSTYLETLLESSGAETLDREFAARYLGGLPIRTTTPYAGIRAVPPAHALIFEDGAVRSNAHWSSIVGDRLAYKNTEEYDDQFMEYLERSVGRRDIPGASILAELSGGMDSTAIVCISDMLRKRENPDAALLDTVSFYDNSEPDWNELPYVLATEAYRGKMGIHVATSYINRSFDPVKQETSSPFPGFDSSARQREEQYEAQVATGGYRVVLSGIGGDELLGGVPTPYPELADHLVTLHFSSLLRRTTDWCLSSRNTFLQTILQTARFTLELYRHPSSGSPVFASWASPHIRALCVELAHEEDKARSWNRCLPSSISNGRNWLSILETMPHLYPKCMVRREYRYPYLDRDLVAYLLRVPREQLVQPGRRRAMMRRALKNLMPTEVIDRRRKAFMGRGPYVLLQKEKSNVERLLSNSYIEALGLIDMDEVRASFRLTTSGVDTGLCMPLLMLLAFEIWLRSWNGSLTVVGGASAVPEKRFVEPREANSIHMARIEG